MRMNTLMLALMPFAMVMASCGEVKDDTAPPEGDADTDADADADADGDADCDTDSSSSVPPPLCVASAVVVGNDDMDGLGYLVAGGGDLDADGFDDVVVLAPGAGSGGTMYVFAGPLPEWQTAAAATASLVGPSAVGTPRTAVILGDTNNDGFDDLVVGAGVEPTAGLYLGPVTGAMDLDQTDALMSWSSGQYEFQVFDAGDVDGNGTADFILDNEAKVFVMTTPLEGSVSASTEAHAVFEVPHAGEEDPCYKGHHWHPISYHRDGKSAALGDLDGDGFGEMIVTNNRWTEQWWERDVSEPCEGNTGIAYIVPGPVSGTIDLASVAITLEGDGARIAGDAGPMGDANGDGVADFFVVGGEPGTVFIVFGPLTTGGFVGDLPDVGRIIADDYYAFDVDGTGDVDGDGLDDLVTGIVDRSAGWEYGAAIMLAPFSGTMMIDDADYLYRGEGENSWAGSSVSSAGDVDADGLMDVLIGASATQVHSEYRGKAYLFYGADL